MAKLPKISVVTPSYQQCDTLEQTILSVVEQRYPDLEYIVCDGGSTDGSLEILDRYADDFSWWVSEPDGGQTRAIQKGLERATGDIMCWLNSDDVFAPDALRQVGEWFAGHPQHGFVYGDAEVISRQGEHVSWKRETSFDWFVWLWWYNYLPQPSTFWRRELYRRAGGVDPRFSLAMDADLWERMARLSLPIHVPAVWSRIRVYEEQRNQRFREQSDAEDELIRERHLGRPCRGPERALRRAAAAARRVWMRAGRVVAGRVQ